MTNGGYGIKNTEAFDTFGGKLNQLSDHVHETGDLVGHMVGDPGLWGILGGQLIGLAATIYCKQTHDAFSKYGEAIEKHKEKLDQAKKIFENQEHEVSDSISRYHL